MSVNITTVTGRKDLKQFVKFPLELYKDCENWVPALEGDEYDTFNPKTNGAYEYSESELYLAWKDGRIVGRVAAIINHRANEKWKEKTVRFGWLDFIEDINVLKALLDAVAIWGKGKGCDKIKGPWGFTDMDKEGLLVEGFENFCPFTCLYNYPYYDTLLKELGFEKDVDWTQRLVEIKPELPPVFENTKKIEERFRIHMFQAKTTKELADRYGMEMFHMYNETFDPLFEFCPLTDKQIKRYIQTYVTILSPEFVAVCLDENDKPVGFAFCVPSISKAVKKSNGKLFPLGVFRILKALKKNDTLEALMIGVKPEFQGLGAALLLMKHLHDGCLKFGIKRLLLNPQLETNVKAQMLFNQFDPKPFMRRRCYTKPLD